VRLTNARIIIIIIIITGSTYRSGLLTATLQVNGKGRILTPYRIETLELTAEIGTVDYSLRDDLTRQIW